MYAKLKVSCCSSLFSILCALMVLSAAGAAGEAVEVISADTSNASSHTTATGSTLVELSRRALRGGGGSGSGRCDTGDGSRSESFVFWCQFSWKLLVGVVGFIILLVLCWYYRYLRNNKSKHNK